MSSSFQQNWFHVIRTSFAKDIAFPVCEKEFLTFPICFYNILLDYDVSLHNLVVLVVTIPTSPRLSKTEFAGESYCVFIIGLFLDRKSKRKEKMGLPGRPGQAQAGTRSAASGALPAQPRAGWPAQAGGRPAPSGCCPAHPGARPAQAGLRGRLPCAAPLLLPCPAGLAGLLAGPRPGCRGRGLFFPNGHFCGPL